MRRHPTCWDLVEEPRVGQKEEVRGMAATFWHLRESMPRFDFWGFWPCLSRQPMPLGFGDFG